MILRLTPPPRVYAASTGRRKIEQTDVTDLTALLKVGKRDRATGVVHLTGSAKSLYGTERAVRLEYNVNGRLACPAIDADAPY
jgi:hypothetical protein